MEYLKKNRVLFLDSGFFDRDALLVARDLLGKILRVRHGKHWLHCRIIETEVYYMKEKGSHSSLGHTHSRRALFMPPGIIYMYYARGGDSLNFTCRGEGNAVLIKSAFPIAEAQDDLSGIHLMMKNNPGPKGKQRPIEKLCSGQTLLCRSLGLKVPDWNTRQLDPENFSVADDSYVPEQIIQTTRLGINKQRDAQLPYRLIDAKFASNCSKNPMRVRNWQMGREYTIFSP